MHNDKKFKLWKSKKGFNDTFFILVFLLIKISLGVALFFVARDFSVTGYSDYTGKVETTEYSTLTFIASVVLWDFELPLVVNILMWVISIMLIVIGYRLARGQS